ncbi:MAG: efflux RND transporter periplasmic adaptor subunit [Candidatus Latescibacteria bacterium]|nr:efflux RND transporter periplasmic adaptor subunit [Candidatus Latescibacterota bacterium]
MAEPVAPVRSRKKKPWWIKLLVLLVLTGGIGAMVWYNLKEEKAEETFATQPVKRGTVVDKLGETGTIELVRTVEVKSTIAGEIRKLPIEAGDWVEAGDLMALIEPDPNQSLQLYQKRSAVEQARINLDEQERNFARQQTLFQNKMIPVKDFEEAEVRLTRTRSNLRLARLELDMLEAKANLQRTQMPQGQLALHEVRVLAPIDGIVIRRNVEIGEVVASGLSSFSGGTVLFEIGDPSRMIVRGDIAEIDIGKLRVGQDVGIVVDAYADTTYTGRVRWIAPVGQKKQGSTIVTFDTEIEIIDKEPRLRQGMSCDLDIFFSRRDSALYLPPEAVLEIFAEEQDGDEEVKGQRGRFITYVARAADSLAAGDASDSAKHPTSVDSANANPALTASTAEDATADSLAASAASAAADSLAISSDSSGADSLAAGRAQTAIARTAEPRFPLAAFVEVELQLGLETTTRIEILSGLGPDDRIAQNPEQIRRKLELGANTPPDDED